MIKGIILQETDDTVSILTLNSRNRKTGMLDTVWFLNKNVEPLEAKRRNMDKAVCFDCPLRGNGCYVNVLFGPTAIYRAYKRGEYALLEEVPAYFWNTRRNRVLRLGGYGDPVILRKEILHLLAEVYETILGYTYQWHRAEWLKPFCMASCHTDEQVTTAKREGWSIFFIEERIKKPVNAKICPAEFKDSHIQCTYCKLCCGTKKGQKIIKIKAHGFQKAKAKGEN